MGEKKINVCIDVFNVLSLQFLYFRKLFCFSASKQSTSQKSTSAWMKLSAPGEDQLPSGCTRRTSQSNGASRCMSCVRVSQDTYGTWKSSVTSKVSATSHVPSSIDCSTSSSTQDIVSTWTISTVVPHWLTVSHHWTQELLEL